MAGDNRGIYNNVPRGQHEQPVRNVQNTTDEETLSVAEREQKRSELRIIKRTVWFIVNAVAMLLLLSFLMLAVGASQENIFAQLVYGLSYPLIFPFAPTPEQSLFPALSFPNSASQIHFTYLFAIIIYYVLAIGIIKIASLLYARYGLS